MRAAIRTLFALGAAAGFWACSNDTTTPTGQVIHVVLTPLIDTLQAGDTVRLQATPIDADGNHISGLTITFNTDNPAVATVSADGLVSAVGAGSTRISGTTGSVTDYAYFTVLQAAQDTIPTVVSVLVSADRDTVTAGDSVLVHATPRDAAGNPVAGLPVAWTSADTTIATVSDSGMVHTRAAGAAIIRATVSAITDSVTITVLAPSGAIARLRRRP
jgi:uncharacterized protein YjdB